MEWLIGLYFVIGLMKAASRLGSANPAVKPIWALTETNPLKRAFFFLIYVSLWPLVGSKR